LNDEEQVNVGHDYPDNRQVDHLWSKVKLAHFLYQIESPYEKENLNQQDDAEI